MVDALSHFIHQLPRRVGRAARLSETARLLGVSSSRMFSRTWRQAVDTIPIALIPPRIRNELRVVCDVGANRGDWTAGILELGRPELVIAFEPIPELGHALKRRFADRREVRCVQAAVGGKPGEVQLYVEEMSELSSVRRLTDKGRRLHGVSAPPRLVSVPLVTLDDELREVPEISLLKLDVQGFEDQVIAGARATLFKCKCVVAEVIYAHSYYEGALCFLELSALIEGSSPLRLSCVSEPRLSPDGTGVWADAVFIDPRKF